MTEKETVEKPEPPTKKQILKTFGKKLEEQGIGKWKFKRKRKRKNNA